MRKGTHPNGYILYKGLSLTEFRKTDTYRMYQRYWGPCWDNNKEGDHTGKIYDFRKLYQHWPPSGSPWEPEIRCLPRLVRLENPWYPFYGGRDKARFLLNQLEEMLKNERKRTMQYFG